ncbi:MAG: hypothetical protein BGO33_02715 [Bacteroidia bacterium 43-41]|nr:MAG: hypothetical protein BGO33_02715 [Bacteroidia bacterium 43-41]
MEDLFNRLADSRYPEAITVACIPFIVGILAIAFPILSGQRNIINTKYSSDEIANLFDKEFRYRTFKYALPTSLIVLFIYLLQIPRIDTSIDFINSILDYSAFSLLFLSTISLVCSLFGIKDIIETYDSPLKLLNHYKKKYKKKKDDKWTVAISHIFYYSIKQNEERLQLEALEFITNLFYENINRDEEYKVEYPEIHYAIISKANNLLITRQKEYPFPRLGGALILELLIANNQNVYFSEKTYGVIWTELRKAIFYDNDHMIFSYWKYAHQYMTYQLSDHRNDYFDSENEIDESLIKIHKERFKEFHYMLGALLLYCKKYALLDKVMYFTQSMPASYKLVPNTMIELMSDYLSIKGDKSSPMHYIQRYSFPDNSGISANGIMAMWLKKYFALLFLRQYDIYSTFKTNYYSIQSSDLPKLPETVREANFMRERIERLKGFTENYFSKEYKVIKFLQFDSFLKEEIYIERKQEEPTKLLSDYIDSIKQKIPVIEKEREIDPAHLTQFKESTLRILRKTIGRIHPLLSSGIVEETNFPYSNYIGHMDFMIMDKGSWTDDVSHLNYDTILAGRVAQEMEYLFSMSFATLGKSRIYKISSIDIFEAIKRLGIEDKESYIIASMGFNLDFYMGMDKHKNEFVHKGNNVYTFIGINVINIGYLGLPYVGQSLFILRKSNCPELRIHEISQETKEKYALEPIGNSEEKISISVVDLFRNDNLKQTIASNYNSTDDLDKSVAVYIALSYELRWSKNANCIQITSQTETDSLDDVRPIENQA